MMDDTVLSLGYIRDLIRRDRERSTAICALIHRSRRSVNVMVLRTVPIVPPGSRIARA